MKHLILSLTLVFTLLVVSAVWAQEGFNPSSPPPPPTTDYVPSPAPPQAYNNPAPQQQYGPQSCMARAAHAPPQPQYPPGSQPTAPPPPPPYAQQPYVPPPASEPAPPPAPYTPAPPPSPYTPPPPSGPIYGPPPPPYVPPPPVVLVPPVLPPLEQPKWIIGVDALWLDETVGSNVQLGNAIVQSGPFAGSTADQLYGNDQFFPLETGLRLQVAGWLNDRTAIEGTYWGMQQWSVGRDFSGELSDDVLAYSPYLNISNTNPGLNNDLGYTYKSRVNNAEINQRIKFNTYNPWWNWSWLWGIRYFRLSDDFTLFGSDSDFADSENLEYKTTNNLVVGQLGLTWTWGWRRFQFTTEGKVGLGANFFTAHGTDDYTGFDDFEGRQRFRRPVRAFAVGPLPHQSSPLAAAGLPVLLCHRPGPGPAAVDHQRHPQLESQRRRGP